MTLQFTFLHKDSNLDYFLNLLVAVAEQFSVEYAYKIDSEKLYFFAKKESLQDFIDALQGAIPLSLYFKIVGVESYEKDIDFHCDFKHSRIFTLDTINAIKNPQSPHFCDIFGLDSVRIVYRGDFSEAKDGDSNKAVESAIDSKDKLKNALFEIVDLLKSGQRVTLKTSKGVITLSLKPDFPSDSNKSDSKATQNARKTHNKTTQDSASSSDSANLLDCDSTKWASFDCIVVNDIASVELFSRASKEQIEALASFEKPLINLNVKDVFTADLHCKNARFILPYDVVLYCLSSVMISYDIAFVFVRFAESSLINLSYDLPACILPKKSEFFEIVVGGNGYFLTKNALDSSVGFEAFLAMNFAESQDIHKQDSIKTDDIFMIYTSLQNPTFIAKLSDKIPLVKVAFDKNPKNILQKIAMLENGDKLIGNFKNAFEERFLAIDSLDSTPQYTQNILDIFEVVAVFLGCEADKSVVLDLAESYLRPIGPKVDFKNIESNGEILYNEILTIRSVMSFALAGVESEVLCFGIVESLVDYLVLFCRQIQEKFYIKNIGIVGDMFANQIFFDKITRKIPASFNLMFPKYLDI